MEQNQDTATPTVYKIHHNYDIGNSAVFITSETDPTRAAVYCQFMAEEWFGEGHALSNLAVANALVYFMAVGRPQRQMTQYP